MYKYLKANKKLIGCIPGNYLYSALTKTQGAAVPRVASNVMTSCRARRMAEGVLEREYIHSSSYRLRGMAVPQLMRVDVEPCCSSPLSADISDGLPCEVSLSAGAREYISLSFAAAQALE